MLNMYDRVGEFSEAASTARVQVAPNNGSEAIDSHSRVRRFPKPITCSFRVNAALTDITKMQKFMSTDMQTGPIRDQITDS